MRDHDPEVSLVAGPDGLDVVRAVERTAWRLLRPGGMVIVEHSDRQGRSAPEVFAPPWLEEGMAEYYSAARSLFADEEDDELIEQFTGHTIELLLHGITVSS